jgi:hypothetical protein
MPKEKGLYKSLDISKILYRTTIDHFMFAHVIGYSKNSLIPVLQVTAGIRSFMDTFGFEEDDYPLNSAIITFYRMLEEARTAKELTLKEFKNNEIRKHENGSGNE